MNICVELKKLNRKTKPSGVIRTVSVSLLFIITSALMIAYLSVFFSENNSKS